MTSSSFSMSHNPPVSVDKSWAIRNKRLNLKACVFVTVHLHYLLHFRNTLFVIMDELSIDQNQEVIIISQPFILSCMRSDSFLRCKRFVALFAHQKKKKLSNLFQLKKKLERPKKGKRRPLGQYLLCLKYGRLSTGSAYRYEYKDETNHCP